MKNLQFPKNYNNVINLLISEIFFTVFEKKIFFHCFDKFCESMFQNNIIFCIFKAFWKKFFVCFFKFLIILINSMVFRIKKKIHLLLLFKFDNENYLKRNEVQILKKLNAYLFFEIVLFVLYQSLSIEWVRCLSYRHIDSPNVNALFSLFFFYCTRIKNDCLMIEFPESNH